MWFIFEVIILKMNLKNRIIIVASGPSLMCFDFDSLPVDIPVLSVNSTILKLPRVDYWFTLDPSRSNKEIMLNIIPGVKYYAAVPDDYGTNQAKIYQFREPREYGVMFLKRVEGSGKLGSCYGLSEDINCIHTGNSTYGALGLAYLLGFKNICILGLDAIAGLRWCDDGGTNNFDHLPSLFESTLTQLKSKNVQVVNGSLYSAVTCFPRMTPKRAVKWLIRQ